MKSNLVYITISLVAGVIATAVITSQITGSEKWAMSGAAGAVRPQTADEAWRMTGIYFRYQPEVGAEIEVSGDLDNQSSIKAYALSASSEASQGPARWGEGRTVLDATPCRLSILRRGWDELSVNDNGYCGGIGHDLSGRYRRFRPKPAEYLTGRYLVNDAGRGEIGRFREGGALSVVRLNLDDQTRPANWSASADGFEISGSSQSDGRYSRFFFRPEEGKLVALRDGGGQITVYDRLPSDFDQYQKLFQ